MRPFSALVHHGTFGRMRGSFSKVLNVRGNPGLLGGLSIPGFGLDTFAQEIQAKHRCPADTVHTHILRRFSGAPISEARPSPSTIAI
jgi:hypothetical protein